MGNGHKKLLGPDGKPIYTEPKLIIIKSPRDVTINPQLMQSLGKITGCHVIVLPHTHELMMGEMAKKEIDSIHTAIHAIEEAEQKRQSE
jgi:galactose-1-phosphate uridylyltransferase|tara:strand:- start:3210 stop:3476 length:267 start_codon:yes stop_codon:yes gene_type:complete